MAPFSFDEPDEAPRPSPPRFIRCGQHGGSAAVEAQRILTHADGTKHVYVFATCGARTSLRPHEFGEYVRAAE